MAHNRIFNFSAGPAVLPEAILETASKSILNYKDSGMGVIELSHRGKHFTAIIEEAEANLRELLRISDDYSVLFTVGGATMQFSMVPMNLRSKEQTADYINTGAWSKKAIKEAKRFGEVNVAGSSEDKNFNYLPKELSLSDNPAYVHFTSNNTIFGTQYLDEPAVGDRVLVCDASSDFLNRDLDINKYGLIYAGAQKNLGPAGVTVVIIRKDLLERCPDDLPSMLNYKFFSENASLSNTPPTFPIYMVGEMLKWIKSSGGLSEVEARNKRKAGALYDFLDSSEAYKPTAAKDSRSLMNVCFRMTNEDLEAELIKQASEAGFDGLKGHRSVGGMRASIYNAFPEEGISELVKFLESFAAKNS